MDLTQIGRQKGQITVTAVEDKGKVRFITIEGYDKKLKSWSNKNYATALAAGAVGEAVLEIKDVEFNGETYREAWLTSFGGEVQKSFGGGGGSKWQPKPPEENLAIIAEVALKTAADVVIAANAVEGATPKGAAEICAMTEDFFTLMIDLVARGKKTWGGSDAKPQGEV